VQAELILLRVLKFELRIPLPFEFLPRYLDRSIGELNAGGGGWSGTEDYDGMRREQREEYKVVRLMETGIARACKAEVVRAYVVLCFYGRIANPRKICDLMNEGTTQINILELLTLNRLQNYQLANYFPARTIAAACFYMTLREKGLRVTQNVDYWLEEVTSGRVDVEDFHDVVVELEQNRAGR
jgi:hypothetical protein